jgi:hypothetical protein
MKTIFNTHKNIICNLIILIAGTLFASVLIWSCGKENTPLSTDMADVYSIEGNKIADSKEFIEYASALAAYNLKFKKIVESLNEEERNIFFENINNEEFLIVFLEKHDLLDATLNIQNKTTAWKQKVDLERKFTVDEQEMIYYNAFRTHSKRKVPLVRLKSEGENNNNNNNNNDYCYQRYQSALNYADAIYVVALVGCGFTVNPIACAACIAVVSLTLKQSYETAANDYYDCKNK